MFGRPDGCGMTAPFRDKGFIQCYEVNLNSNVAGMSQEKLFDMCQIFEFSKYYVIFILIFSQHAKLRQPTGQRQLLENR